MSGHSITVQRLIAELRKYPARAKVCFVSHDHDPASGEFDGEVQNVSTAPDALKQRGYGVYLS